jgi:hypothetical protein
MISLYYVRCNLRSVNATLSLYGVPYFCCTCCCTVCRQLLVEECVLFFFLGWVGVVRGKGLLCGYFCFGVFLLGSGFWGGGWWSASLGLFPFVFCWVFEEGFEDFVPSNCLFIVEVIIF